MISAHGAVTGLVPPTVPDSRRAARRRDVGGHLSEDVAMQRVPITAEGPRLEGVLGPLAPEEERHLRGLILGASDRLVRLASDLRGQAAGHHRGLELVWVPSGQLSIAGAVEVCDADTNAVGFLVELQPGWYHGVASEPPNWVVEVSVEADCLHEVDHEAMETVYDAELVAYSPRAAVEMLTHEVERLADLATSNPPEHWTRMTRD